MFVANILSLLSTALLIVSMFINDKKKMLLIQVANYIVSAIGNLLGGSFVAASTNCVSAVRNIYFAKTSSLPVTVLISLAYLALGLATNNLGVMGLLPIMACIEYTVCAYLATSAQTLRYGALINLVLWLAHDIYICIYGFILTDIILITVTTVSIIKYNKSE